MKIVPCIFLLCCVVLQGFAAEQIQVSSDQTHIQEIDNKLNDLHDMWHKVRLKSMQEEISGQPLIFEEWGKYAEHIKLSEQHEEEANKIQKEIDLLEAKRKQLLNKKNDFDQK